MNSYSLVNIVRTLAIHLALVSFFYADFNGMALLLLFVSYYLRLFGIAAGYHRYFSHRSFETSRFFQFILAFLGASTGQRGPLSWATSHIHHHQYSDKKGDPHSPHISGWFDSHIGWVLKKGALPTDLSLHQIRYFSQFPEIRFINRYHLLGPIAWICLLLLGNKLLGLFFPTFQFTAMTLLAYGFILPTLLVLHGTCLVNSVGHSRGFRRFANNDKSGNVSWLWPLAIGENWHNNHHRSPQLACNTRAWWELDLIYLGLVCLAKLKLVKNIKVAKT